MEVKEAEDSGDNEKFTPRPYQVDLFLKALAGNSIIYLPTGAGKTYIAVMLIKAMSAPVRKPYSQNGKRTIFAVNTVPLVGQQSAYISRHTDLTCRGYSGDLGVDFWHKDDWEQQFEQYQVLVMTAQIFLEILSHGYMPLDRVNLIIFDECHRGVAAHPMRQIMQNFENYPLDGHPRILGMSATLLNSDKAKNTSKVYELIRELEITYNAKVISVGSSVEVKKYGKPSESYVIHRPLLNDIDKRIHELINFTIEFLKNVELKELSINRESSREFQAKPKTEKLKNMIVDTQEHIDIQGIYGGSQAVLLHMLQIEKLKKNVDDYDTLTVLNFISHQLTKMRKILQDEMDRQDLSEFQKIQKFSSEKILKLLGILNHYYKLNKNSNNDKFCAIIFVRRRFTAKTLYQILKKAAEYPDYEFIKTDYVVGFSTNPFKNSCEDICITKWNQEALIRFRTGVSNCLIATDVVDEGVDIPLCSLVVRYDLPSDYRSYVQSKGRARSMSSNYVMMIPNSEEQKEKNRLEIYKRIETLLTEIIGDAQDRTKPIPEELQNQLYATEIKPYVVIDKDGIIRTISDTSSVSLIYQYCNTLARSKFVQCVPTLKLYKSETESKFQVSIKMPIGSPLRDVIYGDIMENKSLAKRSVTMKACIRLHEMKELNERLMPKDVQDIIEDSMHLLVNWEDEDNDKGLIGTYASNRAHKIVYPEELFRAFPQANVPSYLHVIQAKPSYDRPYEAKRHREQVFYDKLHDSAGYAILSSKKMSKIPGFPLFMNFGSLDVKIQVNHDQVILSCEQIKKLKNYHWVLFNEVLQIVKKFTIFDNMNLENNYLIVPINQDANINWNIVNEYHEWDCKSKQSERGFQTDQVPIDSGLSLMGYLIDHEQSNENYDDWQLVEPTYRDTIYIITKCCHDMNPLSIFPTDDFENYRHYYAEKHGLYITNTRQPLLEVKAISKNIDYIKPRGQAISKKRERDNFEEHLIPELCHGMTFPSVYFLKAMYIPSVLHRLSQLLIAEDLRKKIVRETGLGSIEIANGAWPSLKISEYEYKFGSSSCSEKDADDPDDEDDDHDNDSFDDDGGERVDDVNNDNLNVSIKRMPELDILSLESNVFNWAKDKEPIDLERNIENIQLIDIEYYMKFTSVHTLNTEILKNKYDKQYRYAKRQNIPIVHLQAIRDRNTSTRELQTGPSPLEIMYALTTKQAKDAFNLERLETLGDSFLKYITSAYLFERYPSYTEGILTVYKGQIVGNRNLYYCGKSKLIPGRLKIDDFDARSNFIPPGFCIPRNFQKIIKDNKKSANVLYEIGYISDQERKNGELEEKTRNTCQENILSWPESSMAFHTGTENFLGDQIIKDKMVSDSVEGLIGVYLNTMGLLGATKLVKWFGILPPSTDIDQILDGPVPTAQLGSGDPNIHMPWADAMEEKIGYKFNDRSFLLQAFSHPSYSSNNITVDYQRLEFLGDSIIDFLMTIHIYETCGNLNPGDLTDLRSALVNNITFACLTVKYGLHTGLLAFAPNLTDAIDKFVAFQEERDYKVGDDLHWILLEEDECNMAEYVEVPKMLGDLFESLIGAIYLDSRKNLSKVWEILYSLMHEEIKNFSEKIPKDPVRSIHEAQGARPKFLKHEVIDGRRSVMIPLEVYINGKKKLFHGFGAVKKQAKRAAAKQALKFIHRSLQN